MNVASICGGFQRGGGRRSVAQPRFNRMNERERAAAASEGVQRRVHLVCPVCRRVTQQRTENAGTSQAIIREQMHPCLPCFRAPLQS